MRRSVLIIDGSLKALGLKAFYSVCSNVRVEFSRVDIRVYSERIVKHSVAGDPSKLLNHPIVNAYKEFLWKLGINASRYKVLSEYLLRKLMRKGYRYLSSYNNLTELLHAVVAETLIPLTLLDITHARKPLIIRYSKPGEIVELGNRVIELSGREVVISDALGKIMYLLPTKYVPKYRVSEDTKSVIIIGYSVPKVPNTLVTNAITKYVNYLSMFYHEVSCTDVRSCN